MAEASSESITVAAPPAAVMAVIADFPSYPEWAGSVKTCEVLESGADGQPARVHFVLDAGMIKDDYVLAYDWAADGSRVDWHLVSGQLQKSQQGSYVLRELGDATEVVYTLTVDVNIPMLGLFKRRAEKMIMDTALRELKKRVER